MTKRIKVSQIQIRFNVNTSDLAEQIIQGLLVNLFEVTTAFLRGLPEANDTENCAPHSVYFYSEIPQAHACGWKFTLILNKMN